MRAVALLHQSARFVCVDLVIIAFAQRNRGLKFRLCGGAVTGLQQDASELQMRAAVDPFAAFQSQRAFEVGLRVCRASEPGAGW